MVGGVGEYLSLVTGYRTLLVVIAALLHRRGRHAAAGQIGARRDVAQGFSADQAGLSRARPICPGCPEACATT